MQWRKKGLIFAPAGEFGWMNSHAQVPTAVETESAIRIYFSTRPEPTVSVPAFVDLAKDDPTRVTYVHDKPVLDLGKPGAFDENGVMPATVLIRDGLMYMYYTGWSRGAHIPYWNAIGLAVSKDGGRSFERVYEGPIVDRTRHEPYTAMSPYVMVEDGLWHMWYSSGIGWVKGEQKYEPLYVIKYAWSRDGLHWVQDNVTCIPQASPHEANTRPTVIKRGDTYHMWYCYRGSFGFRDAGRTSYRIGYAYSKNARDWVRVDDLAGIAPSAAGWDSDMVEYPQTLESSRGTMMFYNGNGFGAGGFGYALLDE